MSNIVQSKLPDTRPLTIYAVALLYYSADDSRYRLACWYVNVSGDNPLTEEEVIARARKHHGAALDNAGEYDCRVFKSAVVASTILRY